MPPSTPPPPRGPSTPLVTLHPSSCSYRALHIPRRLTLKCAHHCQSVTVRIRYEHDVGKGRHQVRIGWGEGLKDAARKQQLCCGTHVVATAVGNYDGEWAYKPSTAVRGMWMQQVHDGLNAFAARHHMQGGVWPSTGFLAIAVSIAVGQRIGASVSVYGFGACPACNKYDDCDGSNTTDKGNLEAERDGRNGETPSGSMCTDPSVGYAWIPASCVG